MLKNSGRMSVLVKSSHQRNYSFLLEKIEIHDNREQISNFYVNLIFSKIEINISSGVGKGVSISLGHWGISRKVYLAI